MSELTVEDFDYEPNGPCCKCKGVANHKHVDGTNWCDLCCIDYMGEDEESE